MGLTASGLGGQDAGRTVDSDLGVEVTGGFFDRLAPRPAQRR
jgi:hypothetical protein